jgi:hypothetical protein
MYALTLKILSINQEGEGSQGKDKPVAEKLLVGNDTYNFLPRICQWF